MPPLNFKKIKEVLFDILFPPLCLTCGGNLTSELKTRALCESCFNSIPINDTLFCAECGARLAENKKTCHKDTSFKLAAAARYGDPTVQKLIHLLKYKCLRAAKQPLDEILRAYLNKLDINFSNYVVVPIPLHKNREKERGFNQSALLAEAVADFLKIPIVTDCLVRTKNTAAQAEMENYAQREKNILGAFETKNPELIRGRNVLIVDDVYTTGATMREAVATLRIGGAKLAIALVVALAR